jgi:hypothetical protein
MIQFPGSSNTKALAGKFMKDYNKEKRTLIMYKV